MPVLDKYHRYQSIIRLPLVFGIYPLVQIVYISETAGSANYLFLSLEVDLVGLACPAYLVDLDRLACLVDPSGLLDLDRH